MLLTPTEMERLTIFTAAEIARRHKKKGMKLNHPEAIAYITDELLEGAREDRTVADLIGWGSTILTTDDVMEGVADLIPIIQVEAMFPDGTKLVTIHDPIRPGEQEPTKQARQPGRLVVGSDAELVLNEGRRAVTLRVRNSGDRPIQIGSHYHFFETNKALEFDREAAFGLRLDVPAGSAVRFEPGQEKEVTLVEFGGNKYLTGLNDLTQGDVTDSNKSAALQRARELGFKGS
ncbi:urease subunit gamma [Yaniella halotolerans]|uniref:urease subunit gamma n=1 Tax=Yaniella halotolerans TaxID=225453 RepID=UPI0003B647CC|nr:urease subunit gamma [Yaniella halotolerans]